MSIESLFSRPASLPTVPRVVQQLIQSFGRRNASVADIANPLGADPVLSAKTLRLANSAYFRVPRSIATVDDALQMLGFQMVRNLVIGVGTIGAFKSTPGIDLPAFWRYSLNTACAARWLARAAGEDADLAFTLGLVHGLGHLVLHSALPAQMQQLDSDLPPLALGRAAAERALLGYHHGQVSAELALRWNFPAEVAATLRQVPDPLGTEPPPALAAWVHVAAWRARVQHFRWDAGQAQSSCPVAVGQALRRPFRWLAEEATLCGADPAALPVMPPLATLTDGLEAMLV